MDWWIYIYKDKVLLEKRPDSGIWASLWSFPEQNFLMQKDAQKLNVVRHVLTHRHLTIQPHKISLSAMPKQIQANQVWVNLNHALKLGLPKPVSSFLQNQDLVHDVV